MRTRTAISGFGNPCYVQFHYETILVPRRRIERRGVPVETATASQRAGRGVPGRTRTCMCRFRRAEPILWTTDTFGASYGCRSHSARLKGEYPSR